MFDGLQTLLIGSTFSEYKQRIDQAKANKALQDELKYQFVELELSKLAANDSGYSYLLACKVVKNSDSNPVQIAWNKKVTENIEKFGKEKWEQMLEEEAKKGSPYTKERQWKKYKDSYIARYKRKQIEILEKKYENSFAPDSEVIKDEIKNWEDKLKKWETISDENNISWISKIFNIPKIESINIANMPLEAKKVLDAFLFHFEIVQDWATKQKIISTSNWYNKPIDKFYNELLVYKKMLNVSNLVPSKPISNSDLLLEVQSSNNVLEEKVHNLESQVSQQNKMLKDIQEKLERLLSKKIN